MVSFSRRARKVRLHLHGGAPSVEGLQIGRRKVAGHYVLHVPKVVEDENATVPIAGTFEIPARNVFGVQVLPE